jgi:undecaprenol kinase
MRNRFSPALHGLFAFVQHDRAVQFHLLSALLMILAGFIACLSVGAWTALLLAIGGVLGTEMTNSAIEALADRLHPEHHPAIRKVKDMAAAGVLVWAVIAVFIGLLIFLPPLATATAGQCWL